MTLVKSSAGRAVFASSQAYSTLESSMKETWACINSRSLSISETIWSSRSLPNLFDLEGPVASLCFAFNKASALDAMTSERSLLVIGYCPGVSSSRATIFSAAGAASLFFCFSNKARLALQSMFLYRIYFGRWPLELFLQLKNRTSQSLALQC